jgi:hypothetical protein
MFSLPTSTTVVLILIVVAGVIPLIHYLVVYSGKKED